MFAQKPHSQTAPPPLATVPAKPPSSPSGTPDSKFSIINESLKMKGDIESDADILIQGKVHGNIKCKVLIVDHMAQVEGEVSADEVVIRGQTKGVVRARRARFEKTARVESEIWHQSFSAEEGARITGALRYSDEPTKADTAPKLEVKTLAAAE
jgi:cytoskeletal protein CcmA (bactofilin family)